jgi:hypothetical protein
MSIYKVYEIVEGMVRESLDSHAMGDDVWWDLGIIPHPQGGPPAYFLSIAIKGALIGNFQIAGGVLENGLGVTQENVDRLISQALETLRQKRSEALTFPTS